MSGDETQTITTKEALYKVYDESCSQAHPVRTHDVMLTGPDGKPQVSSVVFEHGKPTLLPLAIAAKFHKEGFIVKDAKGRDLARAGEAVDTVASQLKTGQTVAEYEELTQGALYLRCAMKADGETITQKTNKADMVAFLMKHDAKDAARAGAVQRGQGTSESELDEGELARLIPDED